MQIPDLEVEIEVKLQTYRRCRILAWGANLFAVHDKNFRKCQCWALAVMSLPRQMIISVHGTTITEYEGLSCVRCCR